MNTDVMLSQHRLKAFVSTTKPDKARKFYSEILGLKLLEEDSYGFEFGARGGRLRITFVDKLTPQPFTILGWETKDIDSTVNQLSDMGVKFERFNFIEQDEEGIWTSPGGAKVAWFKDPDGNLLSVST